MRISTPAGVIVATGLLGYSSAQATDYGAPGGGPNGVPDDANGNVPPFNSNDGTVPGGFPPSVPSGIVPDGVVPGTIPGTSPYRVPLAFPPIGSIPDASSLLVPGGFPSNVPVNVPGGNPGVFGATVIPGGPVSDSPNCPTQTSTVIVTIYPTAPGSSQNEVPGSPQGGNSGNNLPNGPDSDMTAPQAPIPTQPPLFSNAPASPAVSFFTTLTIDIWGSHGDDVNPHDGTGSGDNDVGTTGGVNNHGPGNSSPGSFLSSVPASQTAPEYTDIPSDSLTTGWTNEFPSGPGKHSSSPFQSQPNQPGYPGNSPDMPPAGTGTGDDQQPNTWPVQVGTQIPTGSQATTDASPWFTVAPGGFGNGPLTNSLAITATADGLFTTFSSIPQGEGQTLGYPPGTILSGGYPVPPQDFPTGISIPAPIITGVPVPQGQPDGFGSQPALNGIKTCTIFTITGADGLPTIVDSTWVIPVGTQIPQAPAKPSNGGISQGANGPFATTVPGIDSGNSVITTCTSYTIIGTDGFPSVVHSTWVIPNSISFTYSTSLTVSIQTGYPTPNPPGNIQTSNTGDSIIGSPGNLPTGIPSGEVGGIPGGIPTGTIGGAASGVPGSVPTGSEPGFPITTCISYTITGTDGLPTVVDSTWFIPGPADTIVPISESSDAPFGVLSTLATGIYPSSTSQPGGISGWPPSAGSHVPQILEITACTRYTILGKDGLPTVVDSTWVIPGPTNTNVFSSANPSFVSPGLTSGLPTGIPPQITGSPAISHPTGPGAAVSITTCTAYTIIGPDGLPTVFDSTWVLSMATHVATETSLSVSPGWPQITSTWDAEPGQFTVVSTALIIGLDGRLTPVVSTVIGNTASGDGIATDLPQGTVSGIPSPPPSGPYMPNGDTGSFMTGFPSLTEYNDAFVSSILRGGTGDAQQISITGTTTGTVTSTMTSVMNTNFGPFASDVSVASGTPSILSQVYGSIPTTVTVWPQTPSLQTSTWTNLILAPTTTYTLRFPLTTMATVAIFDGSEPGKRVVRRLASLNPVFPAWKNSSSTSPIVTPTIGIDPSIKSSSASPSAIEPETKVAAMCTTGGSIGNMTIDFDSAKAGPLFNPVEDIWFSEGFHIAPPSSRQSQPFVPTSGGQLVEFVPISSTNGTAMGSVDITEVGMGPHAPNPCFRFDFFGANLGCETKGNEEWCEFEISAYRYNDTLSGEESIAWTETKRVPACPTFLEGGYELTPIGLDGYTDLSSVLIVVHVGSELRSWWGDDFRVGWTDNSCVAASCRSTAPTVRVKRETVASALRRGIWRWTPSGLERFDDEVVWDSAN